MRYLIFLPIFLLSGCIVSLGTTSRYAPGAENKTRITKMSTGSEKEYPLTENWSYETEVYLTGLWKC